MKRGIQLETHTARFKPTAELLPFRSYEHFLSNHFQCQLHYITIGIEENFASVEHAYFWHMAAEFGNHDLATEIKNSKHAGQAKKLSKEIDRQ